ncbi:DUF2502 domain-containing protein [Pantoea sp. GCM10028869]|uniref:DUF2502 domain-containing protein n=1 Tax=Pantoea sp. BJ2 TaxID=3141322 RepID=A0AAU7U030_9GAMM
MKKTAILLSVLLGMPLLASANVSVSINTPGVSVHIGDQDKRGYYWDGYDWRAPTWWKQHHNQRIGTKGPHGYWNGNGWQAQHPGNGPHRDDKRQPQPQHHDQRDNQQKRDNHGQPLPPHQ